ncbi:hypothetical protein HanPI659440_Chr15g0591321 [Helianthus annuus]|nr:hypothetical protein HanPI659440_Chr15g0591321 [Helianthus annuus]
MNVFDPKAGGAMVVAALHEGRSLWVDQIRDKFMHPSSESMATYANAVLGDDGEDETGVDLAHTREEPILLSSEESAGSYQDLTHRSMRAGPQRGAAHEPAVKGVVTPVVDLQAGVAEQMETRKKRKEERTEGKTAEEPVADHLESTTAPSESEIDLGVFSKKTGNRLEKIIQVFFCTMRCDLFHCMYFESCPTSFDCLCFVTASSKSARSGPKIGISKITPPASPPSKPLDLSPPRPDPKGKGKEDDVEVDQSERVVENVAAGTGRANVHAESVETEWESSEATPPGTVYTKRVRGSRGSGASAAGRARNFNELKEIMREWQAIEEDTMEFEAAKREFATEREAFNSEKKGLLWRVADGEEKLDKEKQFNADRQKEWKAACDRTNRELKAARDEIVRLKGEKTKQSDEHERAVTSYQKSEKEYEHQIVNLEKVVAEKTAESKPSEILAEEISAECKWILARGVPLIADRILKSNELAKYMFKLGESAFDSGRKEGYGEGRAAAAANEKVDHFELYKVDYSTHYAAKRQEYKFLEFAIVRAVEKLSRKGAAMETLKKALGD